MIGIINYGLGNLGSIQNMLKVIGAKAIISSNKEDLMRCDKYILPGVGAFDAGMSNLNKSGLTDFIKVQVLTNRKPILGICLGMQLLGRRSEEGNLEGLNFIPFDNVRFKLKNPELKIPHMGWDVVEVQQSNPLIKNLEEVQRFYFVHSYHANCDNPENILLTCEYDYKFTAAVIQDNIVGVQFHPEKSHHYGMALLENYAKEF